MTRSLAILHLCVCCMVGGTGCEGALSSQGLVPSQQATPSDTPQPAATDPTGPAADPAPDGQTSPPKSPAQLRAQTLESCRARALPSPAKTPLKRLTKVEYDQTVARLLGTKKRPSAAFLDDEKIASFYGNTEAPITEQMVLRYRDAAMELAAEAVGANLEELAPCGKTQAKEACAKDFIHTFGAKAWRHPLTQDSEQALLKVYQAGESSKGYARGIELVLQALLQAPTFLYHVEVGDEAGKLDGFEIASRIAYAITSGPPDDALLEAASTGDLEDAAVRAAHAQRLLETPAGQETVVSFYTQWTHLKALAEVTKDEDVYPEFDDTLRDSMAKETELFIRDTVLQKTTTFADLLQADHSFVNAPLAALYGIPFSEKDPKKFVRVTLPNGERSGLLTQASVLALHANPNQGSPVLRGLFISEDFLCIVPPPTPDGLDIKAPDLDPNLTTRQRFALHSSDPGCAGCHRFMDPIGHSYEAYDAIGRHLAPSKGAGTDASGIIHSTSGLYKDITFEGPMELAKVLSEDDRVTSCMSTQVFRYAFGRLEKSGDRCQVAALEDAWAQSQGDLKEVLLRLVSSPDFIVRAPITKEASP